MSKVREQKLRQENLPEAAEAAQMVGPHGLLPVPADARG